jgi:hypothetical protein
MVNSTRIYNWYGFSSELEFDLRTLTVLSGMRPWWQQDAWCSTDMMLLFSMLFKQTRIG